MDSSTRYGPFRDLDPKIYNIWQQAIMSQPLNITYKDILAKTGLKMSGVSPDGCLPEIVEYQDHPWFMGVQFHPELKSKPFDPHPLFKSFISASVKQARLV